MVRGSERSKLRILSSEFAEPVKGTKTLIYSRVQHSRPCYTGKQDSRPRYPWRVRGLGSLGSKASLTTSVAECPGDRSQTGKGLTHFGRLVPGATNSGS